MKNDLNVRKKLHETALKAPTSSGVYLWRDEDKVIIYVGKAKNLKNRLTSYFSGVKDIKTRTLISKAFSIEYITTSNEYEALILENTLIKQHSPRYNICLKDDKSYPALRITKEKFPRVFKTRRMINDGSKYFGPFPNSNALSTFIENINRIYPLRQCKVLRKRSAPCMYYHIGRCCAPCCGKISQEAYTVYIDEIIRFLEENPEQTIRKLQSEMKTAARNLQYEKAARLRDGIDALQQLTTISTVSDFSEDERDYIGFSVEGTLVTFTVLKMRGGKLVMKDEYRTKSLNREEDLIIEFLMAYYGKTPPPSYIFIPINADTALFNTWVVKRYKTKVEIVNITEEFDSTREVCGLVGSRHKATIAMANQNAKEDIRRRVRERGDLPALEELKKLLGLPHIPSRIEGFDIAHIGGNLPVASLISFYNGNPDKKNYRYYRLKTTDGIIDDFASMREVTARRYTRLVNNKEKFPDLILIDGGIGQVNAVQGVLNSLAISIPIIGLAEKNEDIYLPNVSKPISLPKRSDALRLLQRVRDETHRFATTRNQNLRTKENIENIFKKLPHVGEKRAVLLLQTYTSLENCIKALEKNLAEETEILKKLLSLSDQKTTDVIAALRVLYEQRQKRIRTKAHHTYAKKNTDSRKPTEKNILASNLATSALNLENTTDYAADNETPYS